MIPVRSGQGKAQGGFTRSWSLCQGFKGKRASVRRWFMGQGIAKTLIVDGSRTSSHLFFVRDFHQTYDKAKRNLQTMRYTFLATIIALATGLAGSQAEPRYCVGADKSAQGEDVQIFAVFENVTVSFSHFVSLYLVTTKLNRAEM